MYKQSNERSTQPASVACSGKMNIVLAQPAADLSRDVGRERRHERLQPFERM